MTSGPLSDLLIEAPPGRHFVQLYRALEPLGRAANTFIETGLRRGGSLVLVASLPSIELFLDNLSESGLDPAAYRASGHLTLLDAEETLGKIIQNRHPDREQFRRLVGPAVDWAARVGKPSIRVYGEMVNLLWRDGRTEAAIKLEEFWNELMGVLPFSLFCAYLLDGQGGDLSPGGLHDVCRRHSDVIIGGPERLFEGSPPLVAGGEFGTQIGELTDFPNWDNESEGRGCFEMTRLWLMSEGGEYA